MHKHTDTPTLSAAKDMYYEYTIDYRIYQSVSVIFPVTISFSSGCSASAGGGGDFICSFFPFPLVAITKLLLPRRMLIFIGYYDSIKKK